MDLKKFGAYVLLIGLLIAAYGGVQVATNLPVNAKQSERKGIENLIEDMGSAFHAGFENSRRERKRKSAVPVILVGGLVALLGVGLRGSVKKTG